VITIGYGPVGRTLSRLLRENGLTPVVVELNYETVQALKAEGIHAVYGDASQPEILREAGIDRATSIIFAASGTPPEAVIRVARELNPNLLVLARAAYVSEAQALSSLGANAVVAAEAEVALAMAERLLVRLGATPEQLDRERDRLRAELATALTHVWGDPRGCLHHVPRFRTAPWAQSLPC
jgi:CPA2 family monovalent cation:H+ antiporter-2